MLQRFSHGDARLVAALRTTSVCNAVCNAVSWFCWSLCGFVRSSCRACSGSTPFSQQLQGLRRHPQHLAQQLQGLLGLRSISQQRQGSETRSSKTCAKS